MLHERVFLKNGFKYIKVVSILVSVFFSFFIYILIIEVSLLFRLH